MSWPFIKKIKNLCLKKIKRKIFGPAQFTGPSWPATVADQLGFDPDWPAIVAGCEPSRDGPPYSYKKLGPAHYNARAGRFWAENVPGWPRHRPSWPVCPP